MGFNLPHWENNNNSNNENVGDDGLAHKDTQQNANPLLTLPIPKAPSDLNENGTEVSDLIQEIDFDRDTLLGFKIATDESYFKKIAEIDGSSKRVFTDEEHHYLIDLISTKRFNFLVELKNKGYYFSSEQREIEFKILQSEHYIQLFPPETDLIQVVLPEGYGSFDYDDYESDDEELPYPYLEL
jgi:YHS domain-containing protein